MGQKINSKVFSFSNIDLYHFNRVVQTWNLNFLQLSSGKFSANLKQYISKEFQFGYAKFNKAVKQEGFSPKGVWTFAFVNEVKIYWRNYRVQPKSVIIYSPESEINAVSDANFEVLIFSITEDFFLKIAKEEKMEKFFYSLSSIDVLVAKNPLWNTLRMAILKEINKQEKRLNDKSILEFRESFTKKLLVLLKHSNVETGKVSGKKRLKLLRDAEQYILKNITEPIKIIKIASFLNVSERTLLYAFKNRFDMGPKAFMNILKLNHSYHRLHDEKKITSIAHIARDSGFWHMGQYYKDYKKFFGELPSDTLKSNFQ